MKLLDPSALLEQLRSILPDGGDDGAGGPSPRVRDRQDALAALTHTILTKLGFRLTSLSDEGGVQQFDGNRLPVEWNRSGPGSYTFRYAHEQSSLNFLVKIVSMGARLLVHATALESSRTESYEVELERFSSRNYWPWPSDTGSDEPLVNGFVSSSRIADFVFGFQVKIVQKLVPGLRKEGYEEVADTDQGSSSGPSSSSSRQPAANAQPPAQPWRPQHDPDDEYPRSPLRDPRIIGDRDLDPLGGGRLGGAFAPPPLFGGGGRLPGGDDGGGMYVGPNHPMFRDRFQRPTPPEGSFGPGGGMVPPGARFDPVTPFGAGPNRPPGMGGPLGPSGRGPPRRNLGDPDWDEMPPPGNNVSGEPWDEA